MAQQWKFLADITGPAGDAVALGRFAGIEAKNTQQDIRLAALEPTVTNHEVRLDAVEVLGGLVPGSVSDATMADIAANSDSLFSEQMHADFGTALSARDGHRYAFIAGVIRNDGTEAGFWQPLTESSTHRPVNIDSVVTDSGKIRINYDSIGANMTISFLAVPDETLAQAGFSMGSSVTPHYADIKLSRVVPPVADYIYYNGSTWISTDDQFKNIWFSGGKIHLEHKTIASDMDYSVSITPRGGDYEYTVSPDSSPTGTGYVEIGVRDHSGNYVTTPNSNMKFYLTHGSAKSVDVNPQTVDTTAYPLGNIWLFGVMGLPGNLVDGGAAPPDSTTIDTLVGGLLVDSSSDTATGAKAIADISAAAAAAPKVDLSEVNTPAFRFDQFPTALTDVTPLNGGVTSTNIVRVVGDSIYAVFWGSDMNPYVAKMKDGDSVWEVVNLGTLPGNPLAAPAPSDEHNGISIVVDGGGFIHISGNHHRVPLNYVRSKVASSITDGWESPGMVGTNETEVTYPKFIRLADGNLLFFYRDGTSSDGDLMLNKYTTSTKTWTRVGMVLKGHDWLTSADDVSAYPAKYMYDVAAGRLHLWWVWRDTIDVSSNFDLCYMYTVDNGVTWKNAAGTTITAPVTPAETGVKVFTGGSGHVLGGACLDGSGSSYAALRMSDGENRLYKRAGSSITYTVMGTGMGHTGLAYTPDGNIYALYAQDSYAYIKQVSPAVGTPIKLFPWTMPNWTPGISIVDAGSYAIRMMISPVRLKPGSNYGGVLTFNANAATLADLAAGKLVLPKPRPPVVAPATTVGGTNAYGMVPGAAYGPGGTWGDTPALTNGTFRGHPITAMKSGKIASGMVNVTTAGTTGSLFRIVVYGMDGTVRAQSADISAETTGSKTGTLTECRIAKDETVVIGVLCTGASAAGPKFKALTGTHNPRLALSSAGSYWSSTRSGYSLASLAVPAVTQPAFTAASSLIDNAPIVVITAGDMPSDWGAGAE